MVAQYSIRFLPSDRQIITVQAPWRNVPCVLRVIKEIPASISEARITQQTSTFYLDRPSADLSYQLQLFTKIESFYHPMVCDRMDKLGLREGELSPDTYFLIYNREGVPYTMLEIITGDTTTNATLLHDLLQLILAQPIHADTINATSVVQWDGGSYNVFQLSRDGAALDVADIVHINQSLHQAIRADTLVSAPSI